MTNYYKNLKDGIARGEALREMQLALLVVCIFTAGANSLASNHHSATVQSSPQQHRVAPRSTQELTTLSLERPVQRELAGGQEHSYRISLTEGQYANVVIEQRGIDVFVQLQEIGGKTIASFDGEYRSQGEERVEMVAEAAGSHRLTVIASSKSAPAGEYEIRVTEIRSATKNDRLLYEARKLEADAEQASRAGRYEEFRTLCERALAIAENVLGTEHPFVATLLFDLADYYDSKLDLAKTISLYQRALAIREKTLGEDHPHTIEISRALVFGYFDANEIAKAEPLAQRAVEISQKTLGPEHPLVAKCLYTRAYVTRDPKKARPLLQQALINAERILGPEDIFVGVVLDLMGVYYTDIGDFQQAEHFLLRSQAIKQKLLGPDNIAHGINLNNFGIVARERKDYAKAEEYYQKAIAIFERALGPDNRRAPITLNNLANIYRARGEYSKALETHLRVLRIAERTRGPYHPLTLLSLGNIAKTYAAQGNIEQAIKFQSRVDEVIERNVQMNLSIGSEREKLSYLNSIVAERTDRTISLNSDLAPNDQAASALAVLVLLQRKGRLLDAMSESFASLRQRSTAEEQTLIGQYNDTTAQLARLVINGPQLMSFPEHQNRVSELEEQKERLEAEISHRSAEFRSDSQPVTLAAVQSAIPAKAALIEFAVYRPFDPKAERNSEAYKEPRYVAYVLRKKGEVRRLDLGDAKEIEEAIESLNQSLRDPLRRDTRERSRAVEKKVMQPVRELIADANELLISADGVLNLIPFEALVDEQGRYLIQRYSFTYLTSGRDLLRMQVPRESKSKLTVIANPSFGEPVSEQIAKVITTGKQLVPGGRRRSVTAASDLSKVYFGPLGGTAQEARAIQTLFPDAKLLTEALATESSVKQAAAPSILHLATHGFFLQAAEVSANAGAHPNRRMNPNTRIDNPLLRSGLALAGANLRNGSDNDGILTALEASGLNLWGTKLVVLSACDTGVGQVLNGEGVYGLRRAFVLAGAESLVMSLWSVSDYSTRGLMTNYYKNLKQGMGRGEALRQVQLDMLRRNPKLHPFYWANFIQSGEWANLEGRR